MKNVWLGVALVAAVCLSDSLAADEVHLLPQPCRVMDSRTWQGPIGSGETRPFALNPGAAETQGGVAGCSIPATATAVRLLVHGAPVLADGGYLRVYNAGIDPDQIFASVTLQDPGQYTTVTVDVPVVQATPAQVVAVWAQVQAQAVVDLAGWLEPSLTSLAWGIVVDKQVALPAPPAEPSVDLTLDSGIHLSCTAPYTSYLECDAAALGDSVRASGHVLNFFGSQYLYAHGEVSVSSP